MLFKDNDFIHQPTHRIIHGLDKFIPLGIEQWNEQPNEHVIGNTNISIWGIAGCKMDALSFAKLMNKSKYLQEKKFTIGKYY